MPEPASTTGGVTLTVLLAAFLGPLFGQYALILMASLLGAMWPLAVMPGLTTRSGAFFLFRTTATAVVLSTAGGWYLESHHGIPTEHGMPIVAFLIGAFGNGWQTVFSALRLSLASLARGLGGASGSNGGQQ